jgi:hypothetical protein
MTAEYELALNAVREATAKFEAVRTAYRSGSIGDAKFLAAKAVYDEADKVFELAYTKAQRKGNRE